MTTDDYVVNGNMGSDLIGQLTTRSWSELIGQLTKKIITFGIIVIII